MTILQKASVEEFQRVIEEVFDRKVEVSGGGYFEPRYARPAWVMVPCAFYTPKARSRYELRNRMTSPMYFSSREDVKELLQRLETKALSVQAGEELGVNTTVVIGWDNGVVNAVELEVYDGREGLTAVATRIMEKFVALSTGNSFHFFGKGRTKLCDLNGLADEKWLAFRRDGAGYIRVTSNVKGAIVRGSRL